MFHRDLISNLFGNSVDRQAKQKKPLPYRQVDFVDSFDRETARLLSERIAEKSRLCFAQALASTVMESCCRSRGHALDAMKLSDVGQASLSDETKAAARRFGEALGSRSLREVEHAVGAIYMAALPESHRSTHGIYYTPPALVDRLIEMADDSGIDWRTAHILDPACGGGAFLLGVADRVVAAMSDTDPAFIVRHIRTRLHGYDVDTFGVWLAKTLLEMRCRELAISSTHEQARVIEQRDSLAVRASDLDAYDLVIGNPPYGRVSLATERRKFFERSVYGHANLYGLFTDVALRLVKRGGVIAYVTPPSMLSGLYYKALRDLLATEAPPVAVNFVAEREGVFADVLQETMLATYRRGGIARGGKVGFITAAETKHNAVIAGGPIALPARQSAPWLLPRSARQVSLTRRLREMPHRLCDYGYMVSTGPLVWNRFKEQFLPKCKSGAYPVIWAESVTSDGRFEWRSEKRGHAPWFAAKQPADVWMITQRACVLLQRTTAKEQSRRLIAAELPRSFIRKYKGVMIENHLNMVRSKLERPLIPAAAIAILLNSAAADEAFRCINGSVAVSAFELEELPLPSPSVMTKVVSLVNANAPREKIEKIISAAYRVRDAAAAS